MINRKDHFEAWVQLVDELGEAKEHLAALIADMVSSEIFAEDEFRVQVGHIFTHLSRAWNSRNAVEGLAAENWDVISQLPTDLDPVG